MKLNDLFSRNIGKAQSAGAASKADPKSDKPGRASEDVFQTSQAGQPMDAAAAAQGTKQGSGPGVSTEQTDSIEERFHQLESLARSFSGELGTKVVPSDKWEHTFLPGGKHEIKFNKDDLENRSVDYSLGKVLSESAKARYSHWVLEP